MEWFGLLYFGRMGRLLRLTSGLFIILMISNCATKREYKFLDRPVPVEIIDSKGGMVKLRYTNLYGSPVRLYTYNSKLKNIDSSDLEFQFFIKTGGTGIVNISRDLMTTTVYKEKLGAINQPIDSTKIGIPIPTNREVRILNDYNSYTEEYLKYTLKFELKTGDTIYAAGDGMVARTLSLDDINENTGTTRSYIQLYHPDTGLYSEYVNLKAGSLLVNPKDKIKEGDPIAITGLTKSGKPVLFFRVRVPDDSFYGLRAIGVDSIGNYSSMDLKSGVYVKRE